MPLQFSMICDLLDQCQKLSVSKQENTQTVVAWFTRNRHRVSAHDTNVAALLSTLLPEKRTDRVYCIQAAALEKIIGRSLMLGSSRIAELALYKKPGHGTDLGDCVERILSAAPNPLRGDEFRITVEDIDVILQRVASKIKWSSPSVRATQTTPALSTRNRSDLEDIYRQLSPREAKWFTRLVLKDYRPIVFDPDLLYRLCDPLLPHILKIRDDFSGSLGLIHALRANLLPNSSCKTQAREQILSKVKPKLGTKVGRQQWLKGRSIKHCLDMGHGRMSVEQKIDGEYCQIHVDVSKGRRQVQIFSKSGKDSTEDRHGILGIVLDSLKIGLSGCQLRKGCILEGELVVYDHESQKVLPFHKIRNHVSRRGRFLYTELDSQPKPHERLMIIYYDLLLLDDKSLLGVRHSERFKLLEQLVHCTKGRAELVSRDLIDFDRSIAASNLRNVFAKVIRNRGEGLVLKPDDPYFTFNKGARPFSSCCIKLKKEYIGHFGDVGDFAVVGAGFDPGKAKILRIPNLRWTHFFIACLNNKQEVKGWNSVPDFTIVNVVEINESLLKTLMTFGNPMPVPIEANTQTKLHMAPGVSNGTPLSVAFTNPLVFDMRCFSFDKAGNTGFWSLRFPSVTRIHFDRDYTDAISFHELQKLAEEAVTVPKMEDSQENLRWIALLENADPRGIPVDATSQQTTTTMPTPSPQRSTQSRSEVMISPSLEASRLLRSVISCPTESSPRATSETRSHPSQLVTPPTSSPPEIGMPGASESINANKRDAPSSQTSASLSPKRRKSLTDHSSHLSSTHDDPKQLQKRKVLEDIDGNSSQHSGSFIMLSAEDLSLPTARSAGSVASAPAITTTNDENMMCKAPIETPLYKENPSLGSSLTGGMDPTKSDLPKSLPGACPSNRPLVEIKLHKMQIKKACVYKNSECQLVDSVIFLPVGLMESNTEVAFLLHSHGARSAGKSISSARELGSDSSEMQSQESSRKILLVDTACKDEYKALIRKMEESRVELSDSERDWIDVYDWHVLQDITKQEDAHTKTKSFGGFASPWRRWYCGLVYHWLKANLHIFYSLGILHSGHMLSLTFGHKF